VPGFGELLPAAVWAAATRTLTNPSGVFSDATRTLTDLSLEEVADLPAIDDNYPNASATSAAASNTYGSWVELVANVGAGKRLLFVVIRNVSLGDAEVEIGEGGAGAEAAITRVLLRGEGGVFPLFRALTDNARLSARAKDTNSSALGYQIGVNIA